MNARDIPELEESRKRKKKDQPEDPVVKKARLIKQKKSMRLLRESQQKIQNETIQNLNATVDALYELLMITAGEKSTVCVEPPATEGRQGKNKKTLQELHMKAATCRILTNKILEKHLET